MKRILIDGRFIGVGDSIARYTLELLRGVLKLDQDSEYTLLVRPVGIKSVAEFLNIDKLDIDKLIGNWKLEIGNLHLQVLDIKHYSIAEQTTLLSYLNREKFDLVHFTQFNHPILYKKPFVVTIHDLTLINHSKGNFLKQVAFRQAISSAVKNSKKIISASDTTKKEIVSMFGVDSSKIVTIYHGIDHDKFNISVKSKREEVEAFKQKHEISADYFLYVGAWKSHKNLLGLLEAYRQYLDKSDKFMQLVLVGKIDHGEPGVLAEIERINNLTIEQFNNKGIIATGAIDLRSEELSIAYAGATAYIIPSFAEGFGWPPLEAMACGTPVIASSISCMPEILGEAPLYFDPYNTDEIVKTMSEIVGDEKLQAKLSERGLRQVAKYNWSETVKKTFEIYKENLN